MTKKFIYILCLIYLIACKEATDNSVENSNEETIELGKNKEVDRQRSPIDSSSEKASTKQMSIYKEGMEETVTAHLYSAPNNFPLNFYTYVPQKFKMETLDTGEGNIINFQRNEAVLKLIVLPKKIDTREGALQIAKNYVENEGEAKDVENGFQLASSKTTSLTTEVNKRNGHFYIWLSKYPLEYGDGFVPESHFIKQNLKWN